MKRIRSGWPTVLSAALVALAMPPYGWWPLVFVALAPWWWRLRGLSGCEALWSGYAFGLLFWLTQMDWVRVFVAGWTDSQALGFVPLVLAALIGAWYFAFAGWLIRSCWSLGAPWAIPFVWAGVEVVRSYVPALAFPWSLLATPLAYVPWTTLFWARLGTIYLAGAAVALVTVAVVLAVSLRHWPRWAWTGLAFWAVGLGLSIWMWNGSPHGEPMRVAAGQPGTDLAFGDVATQEIRIATAVDALLIEAAERQVDLVILPEGMARADSDGGPKPSFTLPERIPVVFGGNRGTEPVYQSAYAWDGDLTYADKTRLVIFGEYVPGRDILPFLDSFSLPSGDLVPGDEIRALPVAGVVVGPLICFEGLFHNIGLAQAANGSRMLAILSIDDWFMGTAAPEQLRLGSVWRAMETGLPVVRAATLGHTVIVDPVGRVIASAPLRERRLLEAEILVPPAGQTWPTSRWVPWLLFAFLVGWTAHAIKSGGRPE